MKWGTFNSKSLSIKGQTNPPSDQILPFIRQCDRGDKVLLVHVVTNID